MTVTVSRQLKIVVKTFNVVVTSIWQVVFSELNIYQIKQFYRQTLSVFLRETCLCFVWCAGYSKYDDSWVFVGSNGSEICQTSKS